MDDFRLLEPTIQKIVLRQKTLGYYHWWENNLAETVERLRVHFSAAEREAIFGELIAEFQEFFQPAFPAAMFSEN